jgi:hypothetical protein
MGTTKQDESIVYTDGVWIYALDPKTNTARKQRNPMFKEGTEDRANQDRPGSAEEFAKGMGGQKGGTDRLLGYTCDIWEIKQFSSRTCLTKEGLALWTEVKAGPVATKETATEIKLGSLPAGTTALPAGVKIVEAEDPMTMMRRMQQQQRGTPVPGARPGRPLTPEELKQMQQQMRGAR